MIPTTLDIATALLRCPSVTPADAGALDVLHQFLAAQGFSVERVVFREPGAADIDNLYARIGTTAPLLVFAGHTDVVPPGMASDWSFPPFDARVADGMLYGRGAQDMKAGIAAFAAAAFSFLAERDAPVLGSIAFLITGDEEGPAINGTAKLLDWAHTRGERFDHCIVGEPTSINRVGDTLKVGRRGSLNGRLVVQGRQGHVAYPDRAMNPVPDLMAALNSLSDALDAATEAFDASNLEITTIDIGNPASNVIPGRAEAAFNVRFNDRWTAATLATALQNRISMLSTRCRVDLTFAPSNAPAFLTPHSPFTTAVSRAVESVTGMAPRLSTGGGTSDARFIQRYCPVVELGPVGDRMHMIDERIPLADLALLKRIYASVLAAYFEI